MTRLRAGFDWLLAVWFVLLVVNIGMVAYIDRSPLTRQLGCVVVAWTAAAITLRFHSLARRRALDRLPRSIEVRADDDGRWVAFVTRVSGEPVVMRVPDDVAEHGPYAMRDWIISTAFEVER